MNYLIQALIQFLILLYKVMLFYMTESLSKVSNFEKRKLNSIKLE